ncbi:MAG: hypothetical protein JXA09_06515 [Anaerolineae bacterium]|nr:hypothetical protein [Anaerolineae bacterium]
MAGKKRGRAGGQRQGVDEARGCVPGVGAILARLMPRDRTEAGWDPILDPAPKAAWEVWYRDTFDPETRPSVEVRGQGLVEGLTELWARHLFETVRPGGGESFSRFHLRWEGSAVQVTGDQAGAARLREWIYGPQQHTTHGYRAAGDARLLDQVAGTHAQLIAAGLSGEPILLAAAEAADRAEFERRLASLREGTGTGVVPAP